METQISMLSLHFIHNLAQHLHYMCVCVHTFHVKYEYKYRSNKKAEIVCVLTIMRPMNKAILIQQVACP